MIPLVDQCIRSKRKTLALIVRPDGQVIVRAPLKAAEWQIRRFVEARSGWIAEKKAQMAAQAKQQEEQRRARAADGWLYLGQEYRLSLVPGQGAALKFEEGFFLNEQAQAEAPRLFESWYRAAARTVLTERVNLYARQLGLQVQKLRISSARTRWGSCSSRGTLSFTWRLVMAPLDVIDYVVVHELTHLRQPNHSPAFWDEVARIMPDFKRRRDWLKQNGHWLNLDI